MSEIPDERDITKTQLWQRIDDSIATLNLIGKNTQDTIDATLPALKRTNDETIISFRKDIDAVVMGLKDDISDQSKQLEALNNDGHTKMINDFQMYEQQLDARFADLKKNIEDATSKSISDSFAQISSAMENLNEKIKGYQFNMDKQVSTLQIEMGAKLGDVVKNFVDMKNKFKKISEQLQ